MDNAGRGFESRLAFYKAVEIRHRISPLFLARNLRYYVCNKSPRFHHHHYPNKQHCSAPSRARPNFLVQQQQQLEQSERDVANKRSLTIRVNNCKCSMSLSVFAESISRTVLVEKYEVEVFSKGGVDVDIPLEYAFAKRRHGEYLVVLFERTTTTKPAHENERHHVVKQVFRTDGPAVISCVHCRHVRQQSRSSNEYLHGVDEATLERQQRSNGAFKFYIWKHGVVQSGMVEGNGFRFTLLWSNKRMATTDCRENIQPMSLPPPIRINNNSTANCQATRLEQVLPLQLTWGSNNSKQTLREFRCPICDMFLGSWFGVLTHMQTNHDRFTVQQQDGSPQEFSIHPSTTPMPSTPTLLQPKRPLRFVHTSDAFALYSDFSDDDDGDSEIDVSWKDKYDERRMAEFNDVSTVEKNLMLMWNRHMREHSNNEGNVFALMQLFIQSHQQQLELHGMIPNLLLMLVTFHDFGQLTSEQISALSNGLLRV